MVPSEEPEEKDQPGQDPPDQPAPIEEEAPGSSFAKASETRDSSADAEQPLETEPPEKVKFQDLKINRKSFLGNMSCSNNEFNCLNI